MKRTESPCRYKDDEISMYKIVSAFKRELAISNLNPQSTQKLKTHNTSDSKLNWFSPFCINLKPIQGTRHYARPPLPPKYFRRLNKIIMFRTKSN